MGLIDDLDTEVIYDKIESDGMRDVLEESYWSMAGRNITVVGKVLDELDVRKSAGLRKAVHTGANFSKELLVFDERAKVVFFHYILGNGPFGDVKVFVLAGVCKRHDEVEIGQVETEKGGAGSGDDAVE